jgi:hypothetical protein
MSAEQPCGESVAASPSTSVLWNGSNLIRWTRAFSTCCQKASVITFEEIAEVSAVFGVGRDYRALPLRVALGRRRSPLSP